MSFPAPQQKALCESTLIQQALLPPLWEQEPQGPFCPGCQEATLGGNSPPVSSLQLHPHAMALATPWPLLKSPRWCHVVGQGALVPGGHP